MTTSKIVLSLEKTRISNKEYYIIHNVNLPKETSTKRVSDGWINISQCFKLETTYSNQSKRQKIIDEEEKMGNIKVDKVIGGWGRIQGSWVSSSDAVYLFKKYLFKNLVNLTILSFKENVNEPLPVKQDVKNYQPVKFEFDAVCNEMPNGTKKENKTPKAQKLKNATKSSQDLKAKNSHKRISLNQIYPNDYETAKYTMKNSKENESPFHSNIKMETSSQNIFSDNESNMNIDSPYKKVKVNNANDQISFFDMHKTAFPVMQSKRSEHQRDLVTNGLNITPYNSKTGMNRNELSTFRNYNSINANSQEKVDIHGSLNKHGTGNLKMYSQNSSPLSKKVILPESISTIPSAQSVKKPRMNGEKFKSIVVKALETESESDELITILYATKFPKKLDPNFHVDQEGNTALHWAVAQGNIRLVKYLLEVLKTDPFISNNKGMNCVSKSLFFDNNYKNNTFQSILTILSNCLIIQDANGKLPLHYVADLCSLKVKDINVSVYYLNWILKFLSIEVHVPMKRTDGSNEVIMTKQNFLKNGLNYQDCDGNTPLHILASNGNVQLYNRFISLGAMPTAPNLQGETAFMIISKTLEDMSKTMPSKLKDAVSLGSGTMNSDTSDKAVSVEKSQTRRDSIISDETELQASSEVNNHDDFMSDPKPPILKLERDEEDMGIGSFKIEDGNPFRSASQGNTRKPTVPDLRNYLTYEANMFEHYETIDGRDDRPSSRTYSKSRSEKLAPLNISKISSANNTMLKRSPNPCDAFIQRNRLNNQNMVSALKSLNTRINETYSTLNKIYGVREKRLIDLEHKKKKINEKYLLMYDIHSSYEIEKLKLKDLENEHQVTAGLNTIHAEWKKVIQESLIAQLTLKTAKVDRKSHSNTAEERLIKLQKIGELLKMDKVKTRLFYMMDAQRNDKDDMTRRAYIEFIERMIANSGDEAKI